MNFKSDVMTSDGNKIISRGTHTHTLALTHTHVHAILLCCLDFCFFHADSSIAEPVGIFLSLSIALVLHRPGRETQKERTTRVQRHTVSRSVCGGLLLFSLRFQRGQRARARTHSLLMVCGSTSLHLFHPARLFFVLCRMYVCVCVSIMRDEGPAF